MVGRPVAGGGLSQNHGPLGAVPRFERPDLGHLFDEGEQPVRLLRGDPAISRRRDDFACRLGEGVGIGERGEGEGCSVLRPPRLPENPFQEDGRRLFAPCHRFPNQGSDHLFEVGGSTSPVDCVSIIDPNSPTRTTGPARVTRQEPAAPVSARFRLPLSGFLPCHYRWGTVGATVSRPERHPCRGLPLSITADTPGRGGPNGRGQVECLPSARRAA